MKTSVGSVRSVRSVRSWNSPAICGLVLAVGIGFTDSTTLALPLALKDVGMAQPLAKAVRSDAPLRAQGAGDGATNAPSVASDLQCRTNVLLEGALSETHWILATHYAFAGRPPAAHAAASATTDRLELGRRLAAAGEYDAAQKELEELVSMEPSRAENHLALADCYRLRGDVRAAEAALQRAIAVLPSDPRPAFQLGELYVLQGKGEDALGYFAQLAANGPDTWAAKKRVVELLLELGRVTEATPKIYELFGVTTSDLELHALHARMLLAQGDRDAGMQQLQEVLGQDFKLVRARYQLALAHVRSQKATLAAAEVTECLRQDPDLLPARYVLAQLHLRAGQYDLAHEQAARVRAALPNSFDVRLLLTDVARGRGELLAARQIAEQLVREAPNRCDGHYRLGRVLASLRQHDDAIAELERALAISPTAVDVLAELVAIMRAARRADTDVVQRVKAQAAAHPQVASLYLLLGQLQISTGDDAGAAESLAAATRADPGLLTAYYLLGEIYARQGKLIDARQRFEQVAAGAPTNVAAQMMLALIDDADGQHDQAVKRYQHIVELDEKFAPAANNLAWALITRDGTLDLALEQARRARAEAPDDPFVADTLGWIMYRQRAFARAITYLKEAATALPDRAEVRYHLGMAYRYSDKPEQARTELRAALSIGGFAGADEAQRAFNEIDW